MFPLRPPPPPGRSEVNHLEDFRPFSAQRRHQRSLHDKLYQQALTFHYFAPYIYLPSLPP